MQWNGSANAGFSRAGVQPWLPLSANFNTVNVESELEDASSTLNFVRRLLDLRHSTVALHSGTYQSIQIDDTDCFVYRREARGHRFVVALNFSGEPRTISLPESGRATERVSTHLDGDTEVDLRTLHLRPNEGRIVEVLDSPTAH